YFSRAADELSHLHWVPLGEARRLNLPFITEVVLGEVGALLARGGEPASVPSFDNSGPEPRFRRLVRPRSRLSRSPRRSRRPLRSPARSRRPRAGAAPRGSRARRP